MQLHKDDIPILSSFDLAWQVDYNVFMNVWKKRRAWPTNPLIAVEIILAVFTIIGGLYVLSPFLVLTLDPTNGPVVAKVVTSSTGLLILGLSAISVGLAHLYGIILQKIKVRSAAIFSNILIRLYALIATWLIQGFLPLTWLSPLCLLLILIVCWISVRNKISGVDRRA